MIYYNIKERFLLSILVKIYNSLILLQNIHIFNYRIVRNY